MRKLSLDINNFSQLRELDYIYVDKTEYIYNMIAGGRRFFLSRPRQFGKSLLVSTMKEVLSNNRKLFDGLWIAQSDYKWHEHSIIMLDFSKLDITNLETWEKSLVDNLLNIANFYNITLQSYTDRNRATSVFYDLVKELYRKFKYVAVLIDEYDYPISQTMHDQELSKKICDNMHMFFGLIKSLDEEIRFAFITSSRALIKPDILIGGMNNVQILTLHRKFAAICGYTEQEIDHYFSDHITAWANKMNVSYAELRKKITLWYGGYHFEKNVEPVCNPFSLMHSLHTQSFEDFWVQSNPSTFLIENQQSLTLKKMTASEEALEIFDVKHIPLTTQMFQAGYLSITGYNRDWRSYTLDYPNEEVRMSLQKCSQPEQ